MSLPAALQRGLTLPLVVSPMFLASGPALVSACCKAGAIGTFPALNQRSSAGLDQWLSEIRSELDAYEADTGKLAAPFGVNLVVHKSNTRLQEDLAILVKHKVPLVITSLGAVQEVIDAVHSYGGVVFHDVVNVRFARKAASVGVDGLIAVAAGAGGHAGDWNPFALVNELRQFFDKTLLLAGSLSTGRDIAAARMMGADLAYMGTRFIGTQECLVQPEYKQMLVDSSAADIVYTPQISGVNASFLRPSIEANGIDLGVHKKPDHVDFGAELDDAANDESTTKAKPWKDLWSAGHGVGSIRDLPDAGTLVARLKEEYRAAINHFCGKEL
ncbi:NAD(P)H-dependent flavin oxidoreductase [Thalassolituus oleivorans]|uniref:NAD(P)H-dependent flavin oxidoreductase n=1 Tax=Thalassolituus oleivorans TaxID=187493 RepID=UPI00042DB7EE|nr:nitronate monooxygenase family protein [Thalassolituus oleivorans]AHK16694.1 2-nitropropane dioxygenase [Thalassolituus oleivorans R6-15]MCA6126546.1 2-nitropropane dioxygenase [Thalassolituus oleivorans 4BN06-13]